ncbi:hypothetical protein NUU61_002302 [Penicillium alfredii]|uniref:Major facilitator superfamily (MFS) profile domain-containing protein n=1 Tax=Penicillium alfredii TaxID=1506179 RepID=A0A9W9KFW0_9EURO|nr:uncharacterized protein NUU61_002302 [Penicillium alfredii]KAJ5104955.1 hypothetical protein NUU61_002302 [Penicillium alfredii]
MSDHFPTEEKMHEFMPATENVDVSRLQPKLDSKVEHVSFQEQYDSTSPSTLRSSASEMIVSFTPNDPDNPFNWRQRKKLVVIASGMMQIMNSTFGSSISSNATPEIAVEFQITNQECLVLPISVFLIGCILGPLLWGPSSEYFGRRWPLLIAYCGFMIFTLACAVADSFASLLVFRLLSGMMASAPIAIVGGLFADIQGDPTRRGRLMAYYMACAIIGPIISPWVSGYVAPISWRWCFWIELICSGAILPLVVFMPETYAPVILKRRAQKARKDTGDSSIMAPLELDSRDIKQIAFVTLSRPFRMLFQECIVSLTCLYVALVYAIFYLYFEAYPNIFQGIYGMSAGVSGLMFLPIGLGVVLACFVFVWWDCYLARAKSRGANWAFIEEYRRLPLACLGGPLYVISLFWVGWTSSANIHWVVPCLSGILFGTGYLLILMAMLNYLTDAYETLSASAQSATSCTRSILGAVIPLAAKPMFYRLGIPWACSLIGFLSLGVSVIPFAFIRYGDQIRANSKFCQELKGLKEAERLKLESEMRAGNQFDHFQKVSTHTSSIVRVDVEKSGFC